MIGTFDRAPMPTDYVTLPLADIRAEFTDFRTEGFHIFGLLGIRMVVRVVAVRFAKQAFKNIMFPEFEQTRRKESTCAIARVDHDF